MVTALFVSCQMDRDIEIGKLIGPPKAVINCFPTANGYTEVFVSESKSSTGNKPGDFKRPNVTALNYNLNGTQQGVRRLESKRVFYATNAQQKSGDRVRVDVQADGLPHAWGETIIPEAVPIKDLTSDVKGSGIYKKQHLALTFKDPAGESNRYAVQVVEKLIVGKRYKYDENDNLIKVECRDTLEFLSTVDTQYEPLLSGVNFANLMFNEEGSKFLNNFYFFTDEGIAGKEYAMNLCLQATETDYYIKDSEDVYHKMTIDEEDIIQHSYTATLFSITPEFYRFMKSLNDTYNNELGEAGLSVLMPVYSNVNGGLGIVAGYNISQKEIIIKSHE